MRKMFSIIFVILVVASLGFAPQKKQTSENPGCIVMPEVIEACENSGGRFDYKSCSCVGGSGASSVR